MAIPHVPKGTCFLAEYLMNKEKWMASAKKMGFESFEIYQSLQKERSVTWFQGDVDTFTTSNILGTSIRGIYQGNMANMALEEVDDDHIEEVLKELKEQAQTVTSQEKDSLRKPEDTNLVSTDKHWIKPSMDQIKETLSTLEKKLSAYDPRIVQVASLGWQEEYGNRVITNTYGMHVSDEDQVQYLVASVVAMENNVIKDDYEIEVIEDLNKFDMDAFVKKLCDNALFKLNSTSLSSQTCPVIFEKDAMTSLFSAFMGLFNGELIYKGISPIKDKIHEKIFSDQITIVDDPKNTDALSIANYDDEGCPTKKKVLVKNGVFETMLQDTKSANRMHTESTGNGFKSGYAGSVSVSPMNCCIEPGEKSLEEMMADMKNGLVITDLQGLHAGLDFVTTNFSLQCSGYWVKDGKKDHAISLITVADSFLNLMNKVVCVGSDLDWKYHTVVSPSIAFTECSISGDE